MLNQTVVVIILRINLEMVLKYIYWTIYSSLHMSFTQQSEPGWILPGYYNVLTAVTASRNNVWCWSVNNLQQIWKHKMSWINILTGDHYFIINSIVIACSRWWSQSRQDWEDHDHHLLQYHHLHPPPHQLPRNHLTARASSDGSEAGSDEEVEKKEIPWAMSNTKSEIVTVNANLK